VGALPPSLPFFFFSISEKGEGPRARRERGQHVSLPPSPSPLFFSYMRRKMTTRMTLLSGLPPSLFLFSLFPPDEDGLLRVEIDSPHAVVRLLFLLPSFLSPLSFFSTYKRMASILNATTPLFAVVLIASLASSPFPSSPPYFRERKGLGILHMYWARIRYGDVCTFSPFFPLPLSSFPFPHGN